MRRAAIIVCLALVATAAVAAYQWTGGVAVPPPRPDGELRAEALERHVRFLAQPDLEGRAVRTRGSADARRYLVDHFDAIGLQPWESAGSFEQPFVIGTNVIGVLPGSDPGLADQFVILSAHYDHVGVDDGEVYLGAADNAAGVAVLLEVAARLARDGQRPRRTVVFAAFDAEEIGLLGAHALSIRDDFHPDRFAGMVNLDILGRHTFDTVADGLLAFGPERFPELSSRIAEAGRDADLRVMSLGRDVVGPRSDHVAFEPFAAPWVFFTSGPYADYHKPTDTPERIDYPKLAREARVVLPTVAHLGNAERIESPTPPAVDRAELEAARFLLEAVAAQAAPLGLSSEVIGPVEALVRRAAELLDAPEYGPAQRDPFVAQVRRATLPLAVNRPLTEDQAGIFLAFMDLYVDHLDLFVGWRRELVRHVQQHPPGLLNRTPDFHWAGAGVNHRSIRVEPVGDGHVRLALNVPRLEVSVRFGRLGNSEQDVNLHYLHGEANGGAAEVADYLLGRWRDGSAEGWEHHAWHEALRRVTGADPGPTLDDWTRWRDAAASRSD